MLEAWYSAKGYEKSVLLRLRCRLVWRYCATESHTILTDPISTEKRASSERSISGEKPTCQA